MCQPGFNTTLEMNNQQVLWVEQQMAKVREKRSSLTKVLTPAERTIENKAYARFAKLFNDPMWTSAKQDWYMVRLALLTLLA